jgi:hypothetical protein
LRSASPGARESAALWLAFGVGLATIVIVAVEVNVVH